MRSTGPTGEQTAEISLERLHYGKLASGDALSVPPSEGYGVTLRSSNLQPADDRLLSPPQLMALRRFEPDLVDPAARQRGSLLVRLSPEPHSRRAIFLRARFRPEDGEGGNGRLYQQSAVWSVAAAEWRRHPAALLAMVGAELEATPDLVSDPESVRQFKRAIRSGYAAFLRFTHRYWFHEVSEQAQVRALFRMCTAQLGLDPLYAEVKERMHDMNAYLEADSLRRQANTVVRLTVVTIFGLVGTVATGFLGMNLLAMADTPLVVRVLAFAVVLAGTAALTMFTIGKSKKLSDFLDVLSEESLPWRKRLGALAHVWQRPHDG